MSDGALLATSTGGAPGDLPPAVLLHGGPGLWDYLEPLARLIEGGTLVHRYDQRGCGSSSTAEPAQLAIAHCVADLEELRQECLLEVLHSGVGRS